MKKTFPRSGQLATALCFCALAMLLSACAGGPPAGKIAEENLTLSEVTFADLPDWRNDHQGEALSALARSCRTFQKMPKAKAIGFAGTIGDWLPACNALVLTPTDDISARAFFERWFHPYAVASGDNPQGLFTGYYEVEVKGSRINDGRFNVPLYSPPKDFVTVDLGVFFDDLRGQTITGLVSNGRLRPMPDRGEIASGALSGKGLELLWLADPVDAFFLEVPGAGRVQLNDGSVVRVGFAGQNGYEYTAIGKELIAIGAIDKSDVSMQSIKAWLRSHPSKAREIMDRNRSTEFFRVVDNSRPDEGPIGGQGVPLTVGRSIAIDHRLISYGVPLWLDSSDPQGTTLRRLMVAQDTGGAIRGAVRGDVFWGWGAEAERNAGQMKSPGRYYALLPRSVSP